MHTHLTGWLQIWNIYLKLPTSLHQTAQEQSKLKREVVQLKREMNNTSSQDEFAKWAKLRRRHDKALSDYEALSMFLPRFLHLTKLDSVDFAFGFGLICINWIYRPGTVLEEILVRLVYQDCAVAQHDGREDLHPVPIL